jgi:hypothetical protein
MATEDARFMETLYSGHPADKLAMARALMTKLAQRVSASPAFTEELTSLRRHSAALDDHMLTMALGRLCSQCADRPNGGCCSALMADNTDAVQILINLLLGVDIAPQPASNENCCFLGPQGCLFPIKPIFCLNYNCSHILADAEPEHLATLYQRAAAVLSQQTRIEFLLLEALRGWGKKVESL